MTQINLKKIESILKENNIKFAGLFGSYSRKEQKKKSDIDLLIQFNQPVSLLKLIRLEREISKKLGKKIDLVTEGSLNPLIKDEVIKDLKVFYGQR